MMNPYSGSTVVMDCGALNARCGVVSNSALSSGSKASLANLVTIPNYIAQTNKLSYVGDQINSCPKHAGLYYRHACDQGYIVDWNCQEQIWNQVLDQQHLGVSSADSNLVLATAILPPRDIKDKLYETVFEDFEFNSLYSTNSPTLAARNFRYDHPKSPFSQSSCYLVVDSGYSFTHAIPFYNSEPLYYAAKRLDVGGKFLTNYLKDIVSMRYWNMMEETHLINYIKEQLCYVASNFDKELQTSMETKTIKKDFVLPDYVNSRTGYSRPHSTAIQPDEQVLPLNNERFSIPEILFSPSNVGLDQCGVVDMVIKAIEKTPLEIHGQLYSNILIMGGNALFKGFKSRFENELRSKVPDVYSVKVYVPDDVMMCGLYGGMHMCTMEGIDKVAVTKKDYEEKGFDNLFPS